MRATVLFLLLGSCTVLAQFAVPAEFKDLVPAELNEFLESLSPEEEEVLLNADDLPSVFSKFPRLFEKFSEAYLKVETKISELRPKAKEFLSELLANVYETEEEDDEEALKRIAHDVLGKWRRLPLADRKDVARKFPMIAATLKSRSKSGNIEPPR